MVLISYCYIHPLYKKKKKVGKCYESETCYLFCFKTSVELRRFTHFTSDAEVKDNIKFCSIQLNPRQYLSNFETEVYRNFRFIIYRGI